MSDALAHMFDRNVTTAILREPNTHEVARARRIIGLFVETIGGFAFGTFAVKLARRGIPQPPQPAPRWDERAIDEALAHKPVVLVNELRSALRTRLARAAAELHQLGYAKTMFSQLNIDSVFDDRLAIEISTGWSYACSVIERTPIETPHISPRARSLWHIWCEMAGRPIPEPRRNPAQSEGYIALVG